MLQLEPNERELEVADDTRPASTPPVILLPVIVEILLFFYEPLCPRASEISSVT